jgi:hypothetical protein
MGTTQFSATSQHGGELPLTDPYQDGPDQDRRRHHRQSSHAPGDAACADPVRSRFEDAMQAANGTTAKPDTAVRTIAARRRIASRRSSKAAPS